MTEEVEQRRPDPEFDRQLERACRLLHACDADGKSRWSVEQVQDAVAVMIISTTPVAETEQGPERELVEGFIRRIEYAFPKEAARGMAEAGAAYLAQNPIDPLLRRTISQLLRQFGLESLTASDDERRARSARLLEGDRKRQQSPAFVGAVRGAHNLRSGR